MDKKIKCLVHYDVPDGTSNRGYSLAAVNKSNYIFSCFRRLGFSNQILSASQTLNKKRESGSITQIDEDTCLILLPSIGRGNKLKNKISTGLFYLNLMWKLLSFVQDGDILWVYHSLILMWPIKLLKKIKNVRVILEFEEMYGDVHEKTEISERELLLATLVDAFIFPTEDLNRIVNRKERPYAVVHGSYQVVNQVKCNSFDDGKVHVAYTGTMDPRKGVLAAIKAAKHLPESYHVHILGAGSADSLSRMNEELENSRQVSKCTITYDGVLYGVDYTDFLSKVDIGLSVQDPDASFNPTSFPSKTLSYMANGLRVVSIRIPAVEHSAVGKYLYFYDEQTPEALAQAIMSVDLQDDYDGRAVIRELDKAFLSDLEELFEKLG